jgi:membrane dipeptidase
MSTYYSEQDPLLPKNKGAPEIQGSRPQSINNDDVQEAAPEKQIRRNAPGNFSIVPLIFAFCFFLSLGLFFFGDEVLEDLFPEKRPNPKTIEERVSRILSDTPLIGS